MGKQVKAVNSEVLRWARERSGLSTAEVADAFGKDHGWVESWEEGRTAPTYVQLEKLAYQIYKRPVALFFFPEPPPEEDPEKSFRTLPAVEWRNLTADTRYAIRQGFARQLALMELNNGENPSQELIFRDIKAQESQDPKPLAEQVRSYLGVSLEAQASWGTIDTALNQWRSKLQDKGIFVFKRSFKQREVSGFCLYHAEFPLIFLNNTTAKSRQIFSVFHELAHLLVGSNGITKLISDYVRLLDGRERNIEIFCNRFASEFLVPSGDFEKRMPGVPREAKEIDRLADQYKVSREVILRKLLDRGLVSQAYYQRKAKEWAREYEEARQSRPSGGNYYATQAAYLGRKYLENAFARYYQRRISRDELADYLGVKTRNVDGLERFIASEAL